MSAMVIEAFGDATVFKKQAIQKPLAAPGQLLIEVKASSINPLDIKIRNNELGQICPSFPAVLHGDVAGVVTAIGANVKGFKVGDEVYGCAGGVGQLQGALAQLMSVDADLMAYKPKNLSMTEAAALPLVSLTAWLALKDKVQLAANQTILIYGATGGVGHIAVQLAKIIGAKITTTASSDEKKALAKKMGADHVVNYQHTSISEMVQQFTNGVGYDAVFDTVGDECLDQAFQAARIGGNVVTILARRAHDLYPMFGKGLTLSTVMQPLPLLTGVGRQYYGQILSEIAALVEVDKIKPLINKQQFKFSEVTAAHHYFEQGHSIGKVVLENDL
ncbi:MAG: zinc-dependent alcohol dehydrogenase family protein [Gammaproteobacteria bacterium]|nr:zinc-dependent alcohol dehydrogenase family protein [Gammaproteobacteria bacterium]MBY0545501.1 zinc-dependent alcohol dehydrogenase family protein [Gammaproteobacteria bacterium]